QTQQVMNPGLSLSAGDNTPPPADELPPAAVSLTAAPSPHVAAAATAAVPQVQQALGPTHQQPLAAPAPPPPQHSDVFVTAVGNPSAPLPHFWGGPISLPPVGPHQPPYQPLPPPPPQQQRQPLVEDRLTMAQVPMGGWHGLSYGHVMMTQTQQQQQQQEPMYGRLGDPVGRICNIESPDAAAHISADHQQPAAVAGEGWLAAGVFGRGPVQQIASEPSPPRRPPLQQQLQPQQAQLLQRSLSSSMSEPYLLQVPFRMHLNQPSPRPPLRRQQEEEQEHTQQEGWRRIQSPGNTSNGGGGGSAGSGTGGGGNDNGFGGGGSEFSGGVIALFRQPAPQAAFAVGADPPTTSHHLAPVKAPASSRLAPALAPELGLGAAAYAPTKSSFPVAGPMAQADRVAAVGAPAVSERDMAAATSAAERYRLIMASPEGQMAIRWALERKAHERALKAATEAGAHLPPNARERWLFQQHVYDVTLRQTRLQQLRLQKYMEEGIQMQRLRQQELQQQAQAATDTGGTPGRQQVPTPAPPTEHYALHQSAQLPSSSGCRTTHLFQHMSLPPLPPPQPSKFAATFPETARSERSGSSANGSAAKAARDGVRSACAADAAMAVNGCSAQHQQHSFLPMAPSYGREVAVAATAAAAPMAAETVGTAVAVTTSSAGDGTTAFEHMGGCGCGGCGSGVPSAFETTVGTRRGEQVRILGTMLHDEREQRVQPSAGYGGDDGSGGGADGDFYAGNAGQARRSGSGNDNSGGAGSNGSDLKLKGVAEVKSGNAVSYNERATAAAALYGPNPYGTLYHQQTALIAAEDEQEQRYRR
ncbi:hypothetical protein VaNZ11_016121, partial [Volvox africanus]